MIDTSYINQVQAVLKPDLETIAKAKYQLGFVNVVKLDGGPHFAIFASAGVYESPEGQRTFELSEVHALLKSLGFDKYFEGAQIKGFS